MLINFKTGKIEWRQPNDKAAQALEWNDKSRAVAFVKDDNLYVTDGGGNTRQVTSDGSRDLVYGQSVHRNEFGIEGGLFWNPYGTRLAFYRMDQSMVTDYPLVDVPELDDSTRVIAEPAPEKYPMAGQTSHLVTVGVLDVATGDTVYLKAGDPTDRYFSNISWNPQGTIVYVMEGNRDQNVVDLVAYDAVTGKRMASLYHEAHPKYVEPQHPITFLPWDNEKFILWSEKDGYNHLYIYDINGRLVKQLTSGNWVVMDMLGFDVQKKAVIISANADSPIQQNLYRVDIATGAMTRIDEGGKGWHNGLLSASGRYLIDNYQEPDVPRNIAIVDTRNNRCPPTLTRPRSIPPWSMFMAVLMLTMWMRAGTTAAVAGRPTWRSAAMSCSSWITAAARIVAATLSRPLSAIWDRSRCRTRCGVWTSSGHSTMWTRHAWASTDGALAAS